MKLVAQLEKFKDSQELTSDWEQLQGWREQLLCRNEVIILEALLEHSGPLVPTLSELP